MPAGGAGGGLGGFSKPDDTSLRQWFELGNILSIGGLGIRFGIPDFGISLGIPSIPVFRPRVTIPDLGQQSNEPKEEIGFFEPPLGKAELSVKTNAIAKAGQMITQGARGWIYAGIEYVTQAAARAASLGQAGVLSASSIIGPAETVKPAAILPEAVTGGDEVGLDLGNLLGTLGGEYINAKFGGGPSIPVAGPSTPTYGSQGGGFNTPVAGVPFVDVIPEAGGGKGMCWSQAANCGAGGWIKRRRRRRRRLATASDIRDLSALRDTVGPAMTKTWIATHPS